MKGEWCYFKSHFDKATCERIIEVAKTIEGQEAALGNGEDSWTSNEIRKSIVRFIQKDDWRFNQLFDEVWKCGISANRDFFDFHITDLDFMQFAEYHGDVQGFYKEHHDVFWINGTDRHRKLSAVIQLSDPNDYEGGRLEIVEGQQTPDPEEYIDQGTIIFFPSMFRHIAHPVTRGTRYSIAIWFEGPQWR